MLVWPLVTTGDHWPLLLYTAAAPGPRLTMGPRSPALGGTQQERSHFYNNNGRRTTTNKADIRSADEQHLLHIVKWRHLVRVWAHTGASVGVLAPMLRHRRHTEQSGDTLRCQRTQNTETRSGVIILDINVHLHFTYNRFRETVHQWRSLLFPIVGRSSVYHSVFSKYC